MGQFAQSIKQGLSVSIDVMGEAWTIGGESCNGILDELELEVDREPAFESEEATSRLVVMSDELTGFPATGTEVVRVANSETYRVTHCHKDTEHYTIHLARNDKQSLE